MKTLQQAEKIILREIAGETILVPVKGRLADLQKIYMLEGTAAFIWSLLAKPLTEEEIVSKVAEEFDVDKEVAAIDVKTFIRDLERNGLVVCK